MIASLPDTAKTLQFEKSISEDLDPLRNAGTVEPATGMKVALVTIT